MKSQKLNQDKVTYWKYWFIRDFSIKPWPKNEEFIRPPFGENGSVIPSKKVKTKGATKPMQHNGKPSREKKGNPVGSNGYRSLKSKSNTGWWKSVGVQSWSLPIGRRMGWWAFRQNVSIAGDGPWSGVTRRSICPTNGCLSIDVMPKEDVSEETTRGTKAVS